MARSPQIAVAPAVLRWARRSIGYDLPDAAKRLGLKPDRLTAFEDGSVNPSISQLRKMANVYGRPLASFFLDEPPRDFDVMRDFRRLPDEERAWSPDLHKVFRRIEQQQSIVFELMEEDDETPQARLPEVTPRTSAEEAAAQTRTALSVTLADQRSSRGPNESLNFWVAAAEGLGVMVAQASDIAVEEMRGFSISDPRLPVVVLNGADSPRGRVFTLAHELGHLVLREAGLCDLHDSRERLGVDLEVYCNDFAACLLMPRAEFLSEPEVAETQGVREWSDHELEALSSRYGVSREAVLRRLVTVGHASMEHYLAKRDEFQVAYEEYRREQVARAKREGKQIMRQVATMAVRDLGKPYVRLVLDAYERRSISTSTVADYLGVRLKHLPKITERAQG